MVLRGIRGGGEGGHHQFITGVSMISYPSSIIKRWFKVGSC